MSSFALKIFDNESSLVTFYTVQKVNDPLSETEKFLRKFEENAKYQAYVRQLVSLLFDSMGENLGAHPAFFAREENKAQALPPPKAKINQASFVYPNFPLRLYCFRLSEKLVILFNGGIKTARTVQESEGLAIYFHQANDFTKAIENAFHDKRIYLDRSGRKILDFQNNTEIFL